MSAEELEGEIVEPKALVAVTNPAPLTLFGTTEPAAVVQRATATSVELAKVVKARRLFTKIGNKEHVQVEGWTLLGSMLGVFPVVAWSRPLDDDNGFEARVEARTLSGAVVGAAEAMCTRDEKRWKEADDYAIRSMAQTRATSKALRGPLGFVMQLAGYNPTPAEEMPAESAGDAWDQARPAPKRSASHPPEAGVVEGEGGSESDSSAGGNGSVGPGAGAPSSPSILASRLEWRFGLTDQDRSRPKFSEEITQPQIGKMRALGGEFGWDDDELHRQAECESLKDLTKADAMYLIDAWGKV